jgi:hypothetical protein
MKKSLLRRAGAAFLFLLWGQVATANALPCGLQCAVAEDVAHHVHHGVGEDHAVGHHMAGAKISAPERCGTPQLLVAVFVPADFPTPPSIAVAEFTQSPAVPVTFVSAVPEFATPPPRA